MKQMLITVALRQRIQELNTLKIVALRGVDRVELVKQIDDIKDKLIAMLREIT